MKGTDRKFKQGAIKWAGIVHKNGRQTQCETCFYWRCLLREPIRRHRISLASFTGASAAWIRPLNIPASDGRRLAPGTRTCG
jgi:hypothetical protein